MNPCVILLQVLMYRIIPTVISIEKEKAIHKHETYEWFTFLLE
jgi:hypothetical protein